MDMSGAVLTVMVVVMVLMMGSMAVAGLWGWRRRNRSGPGDEGHPPTH